MSQPIYPQSKNPWYPMDRRLAGPQGQSGHGGKEKNFSPWQESNPGHPAHSLVTILSYCGSM